ncbi:MULTISPECIES: LuxR C-terminal-related transcriptional regulator [unclassified Micromonospora]|uniref:LuxR C-terminal-related transcriptional regulator n=1 Tax=unclassified Micromonospora TaxID=2617518 RepID=UPI001C601AAC|nr:LuxR C-terminal-related transcriptional regulator [Micromonospora sp. RL09-050-HVF-A]MBW4702067.1 helix-turn-helix domain-containing protein [Micromonospora sp. RL09-050-HVF-A]
MNNAAEALDLNGAKRERAVEVLSALRLLDGEGIQQSDALLTPDAALRRLLSDEMDTLDVAAQRVAETQAAVATLVQGFLPIDIVPSDDIRVELVRDSGRIRGLLTEITDRAVNEVISVHPGPPPPEEVLRSGLQRDEIMLRRGIRMRALYQEQYLRVGYARQYLNSLRNIGADVRTSPVVPTRMIICDNTLALLAAVGDQEESPVLALRGGAIVQPIAHLYDLAWNPGTALPHDDELPRPPLDQLAPQHAALLQMLATGLKDEKIARNLGVSPRTLSRLIRELMDALGAQSRFQGGVRAQELRWLS